MWEESATPITPRTPDRRADWCKALVASLLLNGSIVVALVWIVVAVARPPSPNFEVSFGREEAADPDLESVSVQRREIRPSQAGGSPASMALIVPVIESAVSISAPVVDSTDLATLPGFDFGSGLGKGSGAGSGFGLGPTGGGNQAMVGKLTVRARRLGVVLDVSGSMEDDLPKVKRELRKAFPRDDTIEVVGCSLSWHDAEPFDYEKSAKRTKVRNEAKTVLEAMEMLVAGARVDAIYWFSDLQDGENDTGLNRLEQILGTAEGGEDRPTVRLYIRSLERDPSERLMGIVERSRGEVEVDKRR